MAEVSIVAQRGTHRLVQRRGRMAIVEQRDGMVYALGAEAGEGFPDTLEGIAAAVGRDGWGDPAEMRAAFAEVSEREEAAPPRS